MMSQKFCIGPLSSLKNKNEIIKEAIEKLLKITPLLYRIEKKLRRYKIKNVLKMYYPMMNNNLL